MVTENLDPLQQGRLMASVPEIGESVLLNWARPALPIADMGAASVPPLGNEVWLEFEGGDLNYPVWIGGYSPPGSSVGTLGNCAS